MSRRARFAAGVRPLALPAREACPGTATGAGRRASGAGLEAF